MDISNRKNANVILNIQITSCIIETKIFGFYDISPLEDSVNTLQQSTV
jgi:hypothetical protein